MILCHVILYHQAPNPYQQLLLLNRSLEQLLQLRLNHLLHLQLPVLEQRPVLEQLLVLEQLPVLEQLLVSELRDAFQRHASKSNVQLIVVKRVSSADEAFSSGAMCVSFRFKVVAKDAARITNAAAFPRFLTGFVTNRPSTVCATLDRDIEIFIALEETDAFKNNCSNFQCNF